MVNGIDDNIEYAIQAIKKILDIESGQSVVDAVWTLAARCSMSELQNKDLSEQLKLANLELYQLKTQNFSHIKIDVDF